MEETETETETETERETERGREGGREGERGRGREGQRDRGREGEREGEREREERDICICVSIFNISAFCFEKALHFQLKKNYPVLPKIDKTTNNFIIIMNICKLQQIQAQTPIYQQAYETAHCDLPVAL